MAVGEGNGRDRQAALARARRALSRLTPERKLDAIIESEDARALVRSLPSTELYYAISQVGLQDATEVVQLASPAQFRSFVDLGAWKRDRLDAHEVLTWLRAARTGDDESFLKKLDALDLEVLEHVLRAFVTVHDLEEDPDVNPQGVTMESPEGRYLLELHADGVELASLRVLLGDLFSRNPFETTRLLESARWELPSELEETAHRFRSARLADLGFPALSEAVSLFAFEDPDKVTWSRGGAAAAERLALGALAAPAARVSFVDAALQGLSEDEREPFEVELRELANAALVAEVRDPGDLEAVRATGELVRDYLGLGLEHLCGADPALAADCVRGLTSRRIFQIGFSLTLQLKFAVDRLWKEPLSHVDATWLTLSALAEVLTALRRKRPLRALPVEGAEPVPFRSRRELDEAARRVERARTQVRLFRALLGGDEATARARLARFGQRLEVLGTERLLAAAVAHAALEGDARVEPLSPDRLPALFEALVSGTSEAPRVKPETTERVHAAFRKAVGDEAAAAEACSLADAVLRRLCEEWGKPWLREGTVAPQVAEIVPLQGPATL
jgi:hypothetical protein